MCSNCLEFFADFFYFCRIFRKLHKEQSFWNEKRKPMSHNGTWNAILAMAVTMAVTSMRYHFSKSTLRSELLKMASVVATNFSKLAMKGRIPHLFRLPGPRSRHSLNFFPFPFSSRWKDHWFAWRANQWPLVREKLFSFVPHSNSLVSVSDHWRAFWADAAPFNGPRLASCVASGTTEIQGHRQVSRARRS